jgi:PAS domain S-box-containing protein
MNLSRRLLRIIGITAIAVILILLVLSEATFMAGFSAIETRQMENELSHLESIYGAEIESLDATVEDWASWDDTYRYVAGDNPTFVETNLVESTFTTLDLSVLAIFNRSWDPVFAQAYSGSASDDPGLREALLVTIADRPELIAYDPHNAANRGMVVLSNETYLLVSRQILDSEGHGPSRGALVMVRRLDDERLDRLSAIAGSRVRIVNTSAPEYDSRAQWDERGHMIRDTGQGLEGYLRIDPLNGHDAIVFVISAPREVLTQGRLSSTLYLSALVLLACIIGVLLHVAIHRRVISPLERFTSALSRASARTGAVARVDDEGDDEIRSLARSVNAMFERIEETERRCSSCEERYLVLAEDQQHPLWRHLPDGRVVYANSAFFRTFGGTPAREDGEGPVVPVHPDDEARVTEYLAKLTTRDGIGSLEHRVFLPDGSIRWLVRTDHAFFSSDGKPVEYQASATLIGIHLDPRGSGDPGYARNRR